jgi:hypothetical protein
MPFVHPVYFGKALQIAGMYNKAETIESFTV